MARVAKGESAPLGELYLRYGRVMRGAILRWLPGCSVADTEDLVQDIFIALGASAKKYRESGRFSAWLFAIAYRKTMDFGRIRIRRNRNQVMTNVIVSESSGAGHQVSHDVHIEMRMAVRRLVEQLPRELREVLFLKIVEGFSAGEIGQITGVAEATVRTRLHRARHEIRALAGVEKWKELLEGGAT